MAARFFTFGAGPRQLRGKERPSRVKGEKKMAALLRRASAATRERVLFCVTERDVGRKVD